MRINKIPLVLATCLAVIPLAHGVNIVDEQNIKAVGHISWQKQADINPRQLIDRAIPYQNASVFFIRPNDADTEQTSANISINDRFQVSLQPGGYTQVYTCTGINRISAQPTGLKTNDLLLNTSTYRLQEGMTYFFYIDVDTQGNSSIQQLEENNALELLQDKQYQTHQITRVVPNCPPEVQPPIVVVEPPAVIVQPPKPPAPILEAPVHIELEVLFDNDKHFIKPQYVAEIKQVADFMKEYPNTTAVIEGHTDNNASVSYNQTLSERRAKAVENMLVSRFGIAPNRLSSAGYSELRPRATNDTAEGRALNRRVIAIIKERE